MFTYHPLRQDLPEIRIIQLRPSLISNARLRCTLRHVRLRDSAGSYSALSYVWEDQRVDKYDLEVKYIHDSIQSVQHFRIGSNLAQALKRLRHRVKTTVLWVDAICINQDPNNTYERSWQVQLMREIYRSADRVFAWLDSSIGVKDEEVRSVEEAFRAVRTIWKIAVRCSDSRSTKVEWLEICLAIASLDSPELLRKPTRESEIAKKIRDAVAGAPLKLQMLTALESLSHMEYFMRIWILQETGNACDLTFLYSDGEKSGYIPLLLALSTAHRLTLSNTFSSTFLRCLEARRTCGENVSYLEVLRLAYLSPPPEHKASDPRDLIYVRLGLARASALTGDTTEFLLRNGFMDPLTNFKAYPATDETVATESMPSWAIDWSENGLNNFAIYNAAKSTKAELSFLSYPGTRLNQAMKIKGVNIGTIKRQGATFQQVAATAGISRASIVSGGLEQEPATPSQQERLIKTFHYLHQQLGIVVSEDWFAKLFDASRFPLPKFWNWWLLWMQELCKCAQRPLGIIADMIFHSVPSFDQTRGTIDLDSSFDAGPWLKLLFDGHGDFKLGSAGLVGTATAQAAFNSAWGKRAAVLEAGNMCYVPEMSREGDMIVICYGAKAPLVLRKQPDAKTHRIIGPAYVRGAMSGEAIGAELPSQTYILT